jgi:hypothetical protein
MKNVFRFVVGKPEGKIPLGRLRRRWEDNIKINLRKTEFGAESDLSGSEEGPKAGFCEHPNEHSGSINGGQCLE